MREQNLEQRAFGLAHVDGERVGQIDFAFVEVAAHHAHRRHLGERRDHVAIADVAGVKDVVRTQRDEALMQLEAESRRLEDKARELAAEGGAANSNLTRAQLFAADSYKRAKRAVYEYPDDNFIELFDEESRRFFY